MGATQQAMHLHINQSCEVDHWCGKGLQGDSHQLRTTGTWWVFSPLWVAYFKLKVGEFEVKVHNRNYGFKKGSTIVQNNGRLLFHECSLFIFSNLCRKKLQHKNILKIKTAKSNVRPEHYEANVIVGWEYIQHVFLEALVLHPQHVWKQKMCSWPICTPTVLASYPWTYHWGWPQGTLIRPSENSLLKANSLKYLEMKQKSHRGKSNTTRKMTFILFYLNFVCNPARNILLCYIG